ncbi:hypothetical protein [Phaffia rhodozyma]|uniref:Uncharacterized protein n=1 Tax=Phaffia rhodozyma TaxID=264483 RepID=A0A0F7SHE2_PHARH|nr:hypothetical protein [Phaffia rhodozyma]
MSSTPRLPTRELRSSQPPGSPTPSSSSQSGSNKEIRKFPLPPQTNLSASSQLYRSFNASSPSPVLRTDPSLTTTFDPIEHPELYDLWASRS